MTLGVPLKEGDIRPVSVYRTKDGQWRPVKELQERCETLEKEVGMLRKQIGELLRKGKRL